MDIAGEMQVDVPHRINLSQSSARRPSLGTEDRPERGLPKRAAGPQSHFAERFHQPDGRDRLPFPGGGRRDRTGDNELAVGPVIESLQDVQWDLRHELAIMLDLITAETDLASHFLDRLAFGRLSDLDVRPHIHS